eukprot:CAMPEP_0206478194 /NCGR_PEP_ID=MMETSP0324_2-20121206/35886_1 /ASSEMBLY_ACC=CAM_ASM_000836 /TAXON_ID=2866 /ORGANISM="Crypthecodinium cohnii, Strain Seligo" /LENGTH=352 /DNA_ID=CAMNT_0053954409 /DNA_START=412 /DNA_END=1471 /DNA_ORIENTATION=+
MAPSKLVDAAAAPRSQSPPPPPVSSNVDTVFFVDIDGVLNVGIRDGHQSPLLLDKKSIESALSLWEARAKHPERNSIERLASVVRSEIGQGEASGVTYDTFACSSSRQFSDVLVNRFAKLLSVAGWQPPAQRSVGDGCATAVLTSTWRAPQYRSRLGQLEACVGKHLGTEFAFDDMTQLREEHSPEGRIRSIRSYLQAMCEERLEDSVAKNRTLRVVVLDDFYNRPLQSVNVAGRAVDSALQLERALSACIPEGLDVQIKVLHTFTEWTTDSNLQVQVGCGICEDHLQEGIEFLESTMGDHMEHSTTDGESSTATVEHCESEPASLPSSPDATAVKEVMAMPSFLQSMGFVL